VENIEIGNSKLVESNDGQYIEIAPYQVPESLTSELSTSVKSAMGGKNWQGDLLLAALHKSPYLGGLGQFRQELSFENKDLPGIGTYNAVLNKVFDASGRDIQKCGYQVTKLEEMTRWKKQFEKTTK
jgi:hypothetical protein